MLTTQRRKKIHVWMSRSGPAFLLFLAMMTSERNGTWNQHGLYSLSTLSGYSKLTLQGWAPRHNRLSSNWQARIIAGPTLPISFCWSTLKGSSWWLKCVSPCHAHRRLNRVQGSCLWPNSALAVASLWTAKQQTKDLLMSISVYALPFKQMKINI